MNKQNNYNKIRNLYPAKEKNEQNLLSLLIFYFFIVSIGGYLWEVLLFLIKDHQFCNRGFLYGPWLPVYGSGCVFLYFLLAKLKNNPAAAFILSMLIGTVLELTIGWFLDAVWSLRYWDYSGSFLNFRGYICIWSALGFGMAGALWICILSQVLKKFWFALPNGFRRGLNTILVILFLIDCSAALIFPNIGDGITF